MEALEFIMATVHQALTRKIHRTEKSAAADFRRYVYGSASK